MKFFSVLIGSFLVFKYVSNKTILIALVLLIFFQFFLVLLFFLKNGNSGVSLFFLPIYVFLVCLYMFLSVSVCFCLFLSVSVCVCLFLCVFFHSCLFLSNFLCFCLFMCVLEILLVLVLLSQQVQRINVSCMRDDFFCNFF